MISFPPRVRHCLGAAFYAASHDAMKSIELARQISQERRIAGIPTVRLDPIAKARANPRSLRLAINGKCWDCIGRGADPNPRGAIRDCRIKDCTLWPVRPYQRGDGDDETE